MCVSLNLCLWRGSNIRQMLCPPSIRTLCVEVAASYCVFTNMNSLRACSQQLAVCVCSIPPFGWLRFVPSKSEPQVLVSHTPTEKPAPRQVSDLSLTFLLPVGLFYTHFNTKHKKHWKQNKYLYTCSYEYEHDKSHYSRGNRLCNEDNMSLKHLCAKGSWSSADWGLRGCKFLQHMTPQPDTTKVTANRIKHWVSET